MSKCVADEQGDAVHTSDLVTPEQRVASFDGDPLPGCPPDVDPDVYQLVEALGIVTSVARTRLPELPVRAPEEVDDVLASSTLLRRLGARAPELIDGPLLYSAQRWLAAGRPPHLPARETVPDRCHFVGPEDWSSMRASTTPRALGLFTSTASLEPLGTWRTYALVNGGTLFPRPWRIWQVEPEPETHVLEVTTAADWAALVLGHPTPEGSMLYPDWVAIAAAWDAVHLTFRAVAAVQGICLRTGEGVVAPPYWGVESTLWLRWSFRAVELVAVEH